MTDASVGSTRRESQRIALPHNSLCKMGLKTNMKWLHSINRDMRANKDKSPEQLAYNGERISLTLRSTATLYKTGQQLARMSSEYTKILQLPSLPPLTRPGVQQLSSGLYKSPFDPNLGSPAAAQGDTPPTTQSDLPRPPETIRTASKLRSIGTFLDRRTNTYGAKGPRPRLGRQPLKTPGRNGMKPRPITRMTEPPKTS